MAAFDADGIPLTSDFFKPILRMREAMKWPEARMPPDIVLRCALARQRIHVSGADQI